MRRSAECGTFDNMGLRPLECTLDDLLFANTEAVDVDRFEDERL